MNKEQIMRILPHRDNMLLVDEAQVIDGVAYGKYNVRGDEWFLRGGSPQKPVPVPGVILCEMMAQATCVLLADGATQNAIPYFSSLKGVHFEGNVYPGDVFETECIITKSSGAFYFASAKGRVNGKLCVSGDFSFALVRG
jgi:3-hydroxyacyl-[acyl-carrier-protein] dehydratase